MTRKSRGKQRKLNAFDLLVISNLDSIDLSCTDAHTLPDLSDIDIEIELLKVMQQHHYCEKASVEAHIREMFEQVSSSRALDTMSRKRKALYDVDGIAEPSFKRSRINDIMMSVLEQRPQTLVHRPRSASTPPPNRPKQRDSPSTSTLSQAKALHLLPNGIQQMIYKYAIIDEGSMIALIYSSKTVRNNTLKAICLSGSDEIMSEAADVLQYRMATRSAPWPREWRTRWGEPFCERMEDAKDESTRMDNPRSGDHWF